jgi:hypothetical protein
MNVSFTGNGIVDFAFDVVLPKGVAWGGDQHALPRRVQQRRYGLSLR